MGCSKTHDMNILHVLRLNGNRNQNQSWLSQYFHNVAKRVLKHIISEELLFYLHILPLNEYNERPQLNEKGAK